MTDCSPGSLYLVRQALKRLYQPLPGWLDSLFQAVQIVIELGKQGSDTRNHMLSLYLVKSWSDGVLRGC